MSGFFTQDLNTSEKVWVVDLTTATLIERWPIDAMASVRAGSAREATQEEIDGAALTNELGLKDAGAVTSSAAGQISAADAIVTLRGEVSGILQIVVSALKISANDEIYDLVLQASPDSDFSVAANIVELQAICLSAKEVKRTDSDSDSVIGRYEKPFANTGVDGAVYPYLRIYHVIDGSSPSIDYTATIVL